MEKHLPLLMEALIFSLVVVASITLKLKRPRREREEQDVEEELSPEVTRCRQLLASELFVHPFISAKHFEDNNKTIHPTRDGGCEANFTDLAHALATLCGAPAPSEENSLHSNLVDDIRARHILLILCDGMGNNILDKHLPNTAFLRRNNQCSRLRAVFPSTTPAALTTLATAKWPGQHGVPGWDLREQMNCDYPGEAGGPIVQIRILDDFIMNLRNKQPANYPSHDDVFFLPPWPRSLQKVVDASPDGSARQILYISAYNGGMDRAASEFSSWQIGQTESEEDKHHDTNPTLLDTATINETSYSTLGTPEGSHAALDYFRNGIDKALRAIAEAEACGRSTFTYLYTAHPDKHMHALGTDHAEVKTIIQGINDEIERCWRLLGNRSKLLGSSGTEEGESETSRRIDASVVATADHGHITVRPEDMVVLPENIIECLEYANIGVLGKGRHAYLHCRAGLQSTLRERWRTSYELQEAFLLLTIDEAISLHLFGPDPPLLKVRPRLGDFVAMATTQRTLVTPNEYTKHKSHCQGAHGSLLDAEMRIPFVLCSPKQESD